MRRSASVAYTYRTGIFGLRKVLNFERHFRRQLECLRDVVKGSDKALFVLTSDHDGRSSPGPADDRALRLT